VFGRSSSLLKVMIQKPEKKPVVLNQQKASQFTLGRDLNCSYTVETEGFPKRHRLIRRRGGVDFLMIPDGFSCDFVSRQAKDERISLRTLSGIGVVLKENGCYAVPFRMGTAALLKVGEMTIGVEPISGGMTEAKKDQLPLEYRFARPSKTDQIFAVIISFCFLLTFWGIWQIRQLPFPDQSAEQIEKRYAKLILETPTVSQDLFQFEQPKVAPPPEVESEPAETPSEKPKPSSEKAAPVEKSSEKNAQKSAAGKGLLAHLNKKSGLGGMLESRELKNALQGVGVLTTKRPSGQRVAGPAFAFREASGVEEMVAGIAARSGGKPGGGGDGKTVTSIGNPFNVSGSGVSHRLRSQGEIDRVIRQHLEGIRFLYERYLRANPSLQGRVTLRFTIAAEGAVTGCELVSSTMGNAEFQSEMIKRIRLWRFPNIEASSGSVSVVYPFTFLPKRD